MSIGFWIQKRESGSHVHECCHFVSRESRKWILYPVWFWNPDRDRKKPAGHSRVASSFLRQERRKHNEMDCSFEATRQRHLLEISNFWCIYCFQVELEAKIYLMFIEWLKRMYILELRKTETSWEAMSIWASILQQKRKRSYEQGESIFCAGERERTFDIGKWIWVRDPRCRERERKTEHDPVGGTFESPEDKNICSCSSSLGWVEFLRRRSFKRAGRPFIA